MPGEGLASANDKSRLERLKNKVTRLGYQQANDNLLLTLLPLLSSPCYVQSKEIRTMSSEPFCHQRPASDVTCDNSFLSKLDFQTAFFHQGPQHVPLAEKSNRNNAEFQSIF